MELLVQEACSDLEDNPTVLYLQIVCLFCESTQSRSDFCFSDSIPFDYSLKPLLKMFLYSLNSDISSH